MLRLEIPNRATLHHRRAMHDNNDTQTKKKIRLPSIATIAQSLPPPITRPSHDLISGYDDNLRVPEIAPQTLMTIHKYSNHSDTSATQHSPTAAAANVSSAHPIHIQPHLHHSHSFPPLLLNHDEVHIPVMPNPKIMYHYPQHLHQRQLELPPHKSLAIYPTGNGPPLMSANNYHGYPLKHAVKTPHHYSRRTKQKLQCQRCGITDTPEWRRGPNGARTLCNACGLFHAKILKRDGPAAAAAAVLNGEKITKKNLTKRNAVGVSGTSQVSALVPEGRYYHGVHSSYGIDQQYNNSRVSPTGYGHPQFRDVTSPIGYFPTSGPIQSHRQQTPHGGHIYTFAPVESSPVDDRPSSPFTQKE